MDNERQVAVRMCGFDRAQKGNYFVGHLIRRKLVEARVRKLKKGNATGGHLRDGKGWK